MGHRFSRQLICRLDFRHSFKFLDALVDRILVARETAAIQVLNFLPLVRGGVRGIEDENDRGSAIRRCAFISRATRRLRETVRRYRKFVPV